MARTRLCRMQAEQERRLPGHGRAAVAEICGLTCHQRQHQRSRSFLVMHGVKSHLCISWRRPAAAGS